MCEVFNSNSATDLLAGGADAGCLSQHYRLTCGSRSYLDN